jgi:4-hydroxy-3-methylbut-2-enyl diphosphate reductase
LKIILAKSLGYCLGVRRAMNLAFTALKRAKGPIVSVGPLIHNQAAFDLLKQKGLSLYQEGMALTPDTTVIIRAHGLPLEREMALKESGARVINATCPKVAVVQSLLLKESDKGTNIIIWGQAGHPEVEGLLGYSKGRGVLIGSIEDIESLPDFDKVLLVAQSTQDISLWEDIVKSVSFKYHEKDFRAVNTICQATIVRQREAHELANLADALVVVGGKESGNTKRLYNILNSSGKSAIAVENPEDIPPSFADGKSKVGVMAGASTPNWQIRMVAQALLASGRASERNFAANLGRFFRALVLSSTYVGLGCGVYGWALSKVMGYNLGSIYFGLYVYFAVANHLLLGFLDRGSARYNDPDRAAFLHKYESSLIMLGLFCLLLSFSSAFFIGMKSFFCILVFSLFSLTFALKRVDRTLEEIRLGTLRLSLMFNKTIKGAMGWASLLTIIPMLGDPPLLPLSCKGVLSAICAFGLVFLQVFTRCFLLDMLDAKGDRVFERETPASLLGYIRAPKFLAGLLIIWTIYLLFLQLSLGIINYLIPLILIGPLYNGLILHRLRTRTFLGGYHFDLLVDGQFFLLAILIFLWSHIF